MPTVSPVMPAPGLVAHADWGCDPRKRLVAVAALAGPAGGGYRVVSLAPAAAGHATAGHATAGRPGGPADVFDDLAARRPAGPLSPASTVLLGFDFTIGLPRAYAAAAGITSFREFLGQVGTPPWAEFEHVARRPGEVSLRRPFYPDRPGGTARSHLYDGLGLSAAQLRRRCDGTDAETLFWTLGSKQAGKASLHGWRLLRQARARGVPIALWPFDGGLAELLAGPAGFVVAEAYPREFYRYAGAPPRGRWSMRRRDDRLLCVPALLRWADELGVGWDQGIRQRVAEGFAAGPTGEDEFDAVIGLLGLIAVVTGAIGAGLPPGDPAVLTVEGWMLGRAAGVQQRPARSSLLQEPGSRG
jgi:hypothetical protein